jgi:hypothetical protein
MEANGRSPRRWFYHHAGLTVAVCGLLGVSIGFAVAYSLPTEPASYPWVEVLRPGAFLAAPAAGLLAGVLAGVLVVRGASSGFECPRCGTLNEEGAPVCSACGLPLT